MKIFTALLALASLVSIAFGAPPAPAPAPVATSPPASAPAPVPPPPLEATLEAVGSIGNGIYNRADMSPEALAKSPIVLLLTVKSTNPAAISATVSLTAEDMFSKPVAINGESQISVPLQKGEGQKDIPFLAPGPGYYLVHAEVHAGADTATAPCDFGIVPPPHPGVRPDSLFCTTDGKPDLDLMQAVGLKKNRTCFPIGAQLKTPGLAPGQVPPIDWTDAEDKFADYKAHWTWPWLLTNYTLGTGDTLSPMAQATGMFGPPADKLRYCKVYALMFQHFPEIKTTEFYNEPWLFGYGFAGGAAEYDEFQKMFCQEALKLRPDMRIIAGNSSMFVADNIEPTPSCWKGLLQGISHHPYTKDDGDPSWRLGANTRAYDDIGEMARRMGLPYACLTEAGTSYGHVDYSNPTAAVNTTPAAVKAMALGKQLHAVIKQQQALGKNGDPQQMKELQQKRKELTSEDEEAKPLVVNNIENAAKVVQAFARAAIEGLFQGCGMGTNDGDTRYNTAFAVMTHFFEDRVPVADIWPSNELIWGGIFANPKFITPEVKALPRAKELSARWNVPIPKDYQDDKLKVAVIWSATGESNKKLDTNGTFTIPNADGLTAYDMTGRVIPAGKDGLTVPFGNNPVYITSETLSVMELRDRVAKGIIKNVTPVNLYALSLMDDPTQAQKLSVRVENQLNIPVKGTLHLKVAGASEETSAPFTIEASKLAEVAVPWPKGVMPNENNQYAITVSAEAAPSDNSGVKWDAPVTVSKQQIASVAKFSKKTIAITGSLNDWKGVTPVLLDSSLFNHEIDMSQYVLHPDLEKPSADAKSPRIEARVYTAYDKDNVYLAAAVDEDTFGNKAGTPMVKGRGHPGHPGYKEAPLPYQKGDPAGLGNPTGTGDCFEFCFGFRDRVPGYGRQMDDPYAWKGAFFDTDYSYFANPSTYGDMLTRIWGPNTTRQDGYQTAKVPGQAVIALGAVYDREASEITPAPDQGPDAVKERTALMQGLVPNAKIRITRNEDTKTTLYEMAIPRSELKLFDPEKGRCRFGFILWTSGQAKGGGGLNWSDAAGVFDHWSTNGSFPPLYMQYTACQTFFGIEK